MDEGLRRKTFDLGLSDVEAEEPEISDGVLAELSSMLGALAEDGVNLPGCVESLTVLGGAAMDEAGVRLFALLDCVVFPAALP